MALAPDRLLGFATAAYEKVGMPAADAHLAAEHWSLDLLKPDGHP